MSEISSRRFVTLSYSYVVKEGSEVFLVPLDIETFFTTKSRREGG